MKSKKGSNISIHGVDKLRTYSTADELKKWIDLRDLGEITEEDFESIKAKMLNKS